MGSAREISSCFVFWEPWNCDYSKKVIASDSDKPGPKSLLAQIWYGDFYIWGIDAIKFLWKSGKGFWVLELNF